MKQNQLMYMKQKVKRKHNHNINYMYVMDKLTSRCATKLTPGNLSQYREPPFKDSLEGVNLYTKLWKILN